MGFYQKFKMKILILSGSHPRHLYIHKEILNSGHDCAAIIMHRENLLPIAPAGTSDEVNKLFKFHFSERFKVESKYFGNISPREIFSDIPSIYCNPKELNSSKVADYARHFGADLAFIFGTDLIKRPLFDALPSTKINLHLGLSPWYRGSATLFWPFYFLEPQFAGATFHQIVPEADAGAVLHQFATPLYMGDGIHDVGTRTVLQARKDLKELLAGIDREGWIYTEQKTSGRIFLTSNFQAEHLRVIYQTYENNIVDHYINGHLAQRQPNLIRSQLVKTCSVN
mgnify:CR=1 FL=1